MIELKYAEDGNMDAACEKALQQIEDRDYAAKLKDDGMRNIIKYGIACYKKNCKVVLGWYFYDKSIQDKQETFAASWIFLYFE